MPSISIPVPPRLKELIPKKYHERFFLVGGIVRDFLLGKINHDIDLVTDIPPEDLISLGFRFVKAKSSTPMFFLFHHELGKIEITRIEPDKSLTDDLRRRDLTINAMAMSLKGEIFDPLDGRKDLEQGILRACSDQSFLQDPIRIFRAFRFETHGWKMAPECEALIRQQEWETLLAAITIERFSKEMLNALKSKFPCLFFRRMVELNVGRTFLPELFRMTEIPAGPATYHPEGDLFAHTLESLHRMSEMTSDLIPRFCALFHDLGKLSTPPDQYPKHIGHDKEGSSMAPEFCNRLKLSTTLRKALIWTCQLHLTAARWDELRDSSKVKLAHQAINGGVADFLRLIVLADRGLADAMGNWDTALHAASLSSKELGINPELLTGKTALPPKDRMALIHQHQVEWLRSNSTSR